LLRRKNLRANSDAVKALLECFISPNEADSNLEPANVVDGLFAIARGLQSIAREIQIHSAEIAGLGSRVGELRDGLNDVASSITDAGGEE
jgi:hypothetical protein